MMNQQDTVPDEALVEATQRGDRHAAARLYNRHGDRVHRICYRIVPDPSQVQDCVQEVWLKVFQKLGRFRCDGSFATWLNTVTANTAIDHYRKWVGHSRHVKCGGTHPDTAAMDENPGNEQLDNALIHERICDALEGISVNQRTAFVLRYYEDVPISEIATIIGCTQGAVRTHIRRSLLALRAKLAGKIDV
ncbi:MAG: sigma-70 family RNA polymerase sigma factor [Phycisphaeraceae bacterium]|nr:sigma-70 family RNA polymerase sigma factor [Phycisphaeraceae bacterium]